MPDSLDKASSVEKINRAGKNKACGASCQSVSKPSREAEAGASQVVSADVNNRTITPNRVGKPSNVIQLSKIAERNQPSIVDCLENARNKRKEFSSHSGSDSNSSSPGRSPKKFRGPVDPLDSPPDDTESSERNTVSPVATMDDIDSPVVQAIMKRFEELSIQVGKASDAHSQKLANLESTINDKFEDQERRLIHMEAELSELREVKEINEALKSRIEVLEARETTDSVEPSNSYLAEWLEKVSRSQEMRAKKEKALNIIISGVDVSGENLRQSVAEFLSKYFKMENVNNLVGGVELVGSKEKKSVRVMLTDEEAKSKILRMKSSCLKGLPFYVDNDCTPLESEIGWRVKLDGE